MNSTIVEVVRSVWICGCTMAKIVIMEQNLKVNRSLANLPGEIVGDRAQRVNVFNLYNLSLVSNSCRCHGVRLYCTISKRSAGYEGTGGWGLSRSFLVVQWVLVLRAVRCGITEQSARRIKQRTNQKVLPHASPFFSPL